MAMTPMPLATAALPTAAMRVCHILTHGQWLHMKMTSVPFLPAAPAMVTSDPSTLFMAASLIGAAAPRASEDDSWAGARVARDRVAARASGSASERLIVVVPP